MSFALSSGDKFETSTTCENEMSAFRHLTPLIAAVQASKNVSETSNHAEKMQWQVMRKSEVNDVNNDKNDQNDNNEWTLTVRSSKTHNSSNEIVKIKAQRHPKHIKRVNKSKMNIKKNMQRLAKEVAVRKQMLDKILQRIKDFRIST